MHTAILHSKENSVTIFLTLLFWIIRMDSTISNQLVNHTGLGKALMYINCRYYVCAYLLIFLRCHTSVLVHDIINNNTSRPFDSINNRPLQQ